MRVSVDRDICLRHGLCTRTQPEVFALDENGLIAWVEHPTNDQEAKVRDAADDCPAQAISIQE